MSSVHCIYHAYNEIFLNGETPVFNQISGGALGFVINKYLRAELALYPVFENRNKSQLQMVFFNNIPFKMGIKHTLI
jgi:hypothetical protein